jgi:Mg2+ and Co2+ transporter CorA
MAGHHYAFNALCKAQNPASKNVYDELKPSLFLEPNDPDARVEVYSPSSFPIESSTLPSRSTSTLSDINKPPVEICHETDELAAHHGEWRDGRTVSAGRRLGLISLRDRQAIKQYVAAAPDFQAFFIRQYHSYSPLKITHDLFETLMLEVCVSPQFKEYVLYMGEREREVEIAPPRLRWRAIPSHDPASLTSYQCMYGLRFVELNGRGNLKNPTSQWSLRQSAVYCNFQSTQASSMWMFVTLPKLAEGRLEDYLRTCSRTSAPNSFDIHLLLLDTVIANWRPYLVDLSAEIDKHAAQSLGASPDDQGPFTMAECGERQALMILDEKISNAALVIKTTADNVKAQLASYKSIKHLEESRDPFEADPVSFMYLEQLRELELLSTRIDALRSRLQGITNVVSIFLDLGSGIALQNLAKESGKENEEMRKLSESMHELTKKSMQDAAAVKVLTILTLVYLPTTVVSNFFSTSFVNSEPASGAGAHITVSSDWWIFAVVSIPLTLLTLYVWLVWMRIQAYGRYPSWWYRRKDRARTARDGAVWREDCEKKS